MDGLGVVASVIAVIDLSAKVAALCYQYYSAVSSARADITRLQTQVNLLGTALRAARQLVEGPGSQALDSSRDLVDLFHHCVEDLQKLESRLELGSMKKARRFGFRSLKWPFTSKEVKEMVTSLERYEKTILLGLQVDQTVLLQDIQEEVRNLHLDKLEAASITNKTHIIIPFPRDPDFVKRPDIWEWVTEQYKSSARRIALVGIGGFGKSQIAIQFAYKVHYDSPGTAIFWVHARTKATFEESYRSLADVLELPLRHEPGVNVLALVRDYLQREELGSWLMIVDNADDVAVLFQKDETIAKGQSNERAPLASFLPRAGIGKILVTSRNVEAAEKLTGSGRMILRIPTMEEPQALQMLRNKLGSEIDETASIDLVRALDCIPLAVNQAASYIYRRSPRISIRSYIEEFHRSERRKGSLLRSDAGDLHRYEDVSNSVVVTWQVTFEQIRRERPRAANLLSFMSFFQPQGIPDYILDGYDDPIDDAASDSAEETTNDVEISDDKSCDDNNCDDRGSDEGSDDREIFEDDLDMLRSYSLVTMSAIPGFCEMHSLVQFCTQLWISEFGDLQPWKELFILQAAQHFPSGNFETWEQCRTLLPHIQPLLIKPPRKRAYRLAWSKLITDVSWYMFMMGKYSQAEELLKTAIAVKEPILGKDHPEMLLSMGYLASTYRHQGRLKDAEVLDLQVTEIGKTVLGREHPGTLVAISNLATTYCIQGRWKEAELLLIQVVDTQTRLSGNDHGDTLLSMGNLASIYRNQGRWKEAEALDEQVTESWKKLRGEEHPDTLLSMSNLASTYRNQGRWKEAETLEVRILEIRKRVMGEEHPSTLLSMGNLASTYQNQGRWNESEELEVFVTAARRRILGKEHPDTLLSSGNLASTYRSQGRWKEAEELEVWISEARRRVLGEEHPDTLLSISNLASTYRNQGRWREAEELEMQVMETRKRTLGEEHPDTLLSIGNLSLAYMSQERWEKAEELELKVVEMQKRVLGEEHPDTLCTMGNLSVALDNQGRLEEAEALGAHVLETRKRVLGEEHYSTLIAMRNLARLWHGLGRFSEAIELLQDCVRLERKSNGADNQDFQTLTETLRLWREELVDAERGEPGK